jgi:hypothetical protein
MATSGIWARAVVAVGAVLCGVGCGPTELNRAGPGSGVDAGRSTGPSIPVAAPATAPELDQKASIHAAYLSARMKEAASDARYAITPSKLAPLAARSWSKGFEGRFDERGVALSPSDGTDWQGRMDVVRFGCGEKLEAVTGGAAPVRDAKDANRLSYSRHAGREMFTESWVNGEPGMEQGFTVARSPCAERGGASSELTIEIAVEGLTVGMRDGKTEGGAVELRGEDGGVRLRYADLYAYDAAGTVLPARMVVEGGRVALRVEVDGARWPVVVDPVVATLEAKLQQVVGAASGQFGSSVSVSGGTAVVGANQEDIGGNIDQGAAYVFVRNGVTWLRQQKLTASDGAAGDLFGTSVSVQGDTVVVGANQGDVGGNVDQGSAYVFLRTGGVWAQQGKLTAGDGAASDLFGASVSVSANTAVVGAYQGDVGANIDQGAAYVFFRTGGVWAQQGKLTASDGAASDLFGASVSVDGISATGPGENFVLVGAHQHDTGGISDQGSAYVFSRTGTTWAQQGQLTPIVGGVKAQFGISVSLSSNGLTTMTALVGAPGEIVFAPPDTYQGGAYVYVGSGTGWSYQARLAQSTGIGGGGGQRFGASVSLSGDTALVSTNVGSRAYVYVRSGASWNPSPTILSATSGNQVFGYSVSISGNTALAGNPLDPTGSIDQGSAHVFLRTGSAWAEEAYLRTSTGAPLDGAPGDRFGYSVCASGGTAVVGAYQDDVGANVDQGSAYVFVRTGTTWGQQGKLTASDGAPSDRFGCSVSVSGDTAVVGAYQDDVGANTDQGSAYVFFRTGITWAQQAKLTASDGAALHLFGTSVSVSGDTVLAGAPATSTGLGGAAYAYVRTGTTWAQQGKLGSSSATGDRVGFSVSVSGDNALVGAPGDDVFWVDQGSVWVFARSGTTWAQTTGLLSYADTGDYFGSSVSLSGNTALVGTPGDDAPNVDQGSAEVFVWNGAPGGPWSQQAHLTASDGLAADAFGSSVSVSGDTAVVGANSDDVAGKANQGSVYLFVRSGAAWTQQPPLTPTDGLAGDFFGTSVSVSGDTVVCGSPSADPGSNADQGSAYVFRLQGTVGYKCLTQSDCFANYSCVDGVCCTSPCSGSCDVCSVALGATTDGHCAVFAARKPGIPSCAGNLLCDGLSGNCPSVCTSDSLCAAGSYCTSAGTCATSKATGQSCDPTTDCKNSASCALCQSGNCADGFCCNVPCDGSCESCAAATSVGADGTCSAVDVRTPSTPTPLLPLGCPGGVLCNGTTRSCPGGCTLDTQCLGGNYCDVSLGVCSPKVGHGSVCFGSNECTTAGGCVDGVCCDTACTGLCQACTAALKVTGLDDGTCGSAKAGLDPHNQCSQDSPTTCGQTGSCDGSGACAYYGAATTCGPNVCVGNESREQHCAGALTCQPSGSGVPCAPYACLAATGACAASCSSDAECAPPGNYCDTTASPPGCVQRKSLGVTCSVTNECAANTFCVDGVCCNSACTGACQACSAALQESGVDGQCGPAKAGATDPGCTATGAGTCATIGSCDAAGQCAKWASGTACGVTACDGAANTSTGQLCDGLGGCSQATTPVTCAPYRCGATACKTVCTVGADCVSGYYCNGGACVAQRTDGATCSIAAECGSGTCVDGVCCKTACAGACMACTAARKGGGVDGECGAVAVGTDPDSECSADSPTTCGQNGQCDGAGACGYYDASTTCGQGVCVGNESRPRVCTAKLTCGASAAGTPCGAFKCQASTGQCLASCSADTDCVTGSYCDGASSQCVSKRSVGAPCGASSECAAVGTGPGFCADGFCCDAQCTGTCQACSASKKGQGTDGSCGPIIAASDPDNECTADTKISCTQDGQCDGAGKCRLWASGTDCSATPGANTCTGNKAVGKVCDGVGVCSLNTAGIDCAPQKCVNGACAACVTSADCLDPNATYCDSAGVCQPRKAQGASCTTSAQCLSTFCVDGVCCAEVCDKGCEWCGDTNAPGVCEPAPKGSPKSGRPACSGTGSCGAQCDGTKRDGCVYPGSATTCGAAKCQGDWVISAGTCDSSGGCAAGTLQDCGNYSCDSAAGACKTACTTKLDCRLGAVCDTSAGTGTCNATGAACQGAYNVKASDGTVSSCNGYRCVSGACQQQCGTTADCATGYSCTGSSCVADAGTGTGGASGTGGVASTSTGGASATGGATSTGGAASTGGTTGSAGSGASAGTGAATGAGGTTSGAGGASPTGPDAGAAAAKGAAGDAGSATSKDAGGCGCRVPRRGSTGGAAPDAAWLVLALAALSRRRSRRNAAGGGRRATPRHR